MPELPRISGNEAIKIFKKLGFYEARQRGSHVVMRRGDKGCVIPEFRISAGEFLEKSLISNISVVDQKRAAALDPENYPNYGEYIRAQYELWFGKKLSIDDFKKGEWRFELSEILKGHLVFQNLLKVLGGKIRRYEDIFDDLQRVTPELRNVSQTYRVNVLNSLLSLVSSAAIKNSGRVFPFLHIRHHLWLRELRRMVGQGDIFFQIKADHIPIKFLRGIFFRLADNCILVLVTPHKIIRRSAQIKGQHFININQHVFLGLTQRFN